MTVEEIVCPCCGGVARRAPFYRDQTIIGETVAKPSLSRSAVNGKGQFRLSLAQEAHHEIIHDCEKAGVEPPDFLARAKERVRRGVVQPARLAKTE